MGEIASKKSNIPRFMIDIVLSIVKGRFLNYFINIIYLEFFII